MVRMTHGHVSVGCPGVVEVRWEGIGLRVQRPRLVQVDLRVGILGQVPCVWAPLGGLGSNMLGEPVLPALFCPRHILEEPAVPAVCLEAPGGQDIPDALQCAGVPDPEAQAQAPQLELSPCHRLLPLQGRWLLGHAASHGVSSHCPFFLFPVLFPIGLWPGDKSWLCLLGICDLKQVTSSP